MRTLKHLLLVLLASCLLSPAAQGGPIADSSAVFVSRIEINGPPLLTEEEIESATSQLRNRLVAFDELLALRRKLTELVIDKGYLSSGVVIPDQEVRDGVIEYRIVSSELTELEIDGNSGLRSEYIANLVARRLEGPLNVEAVNASIRDIERLGIVSSVNGSLQPGERLGESVLSLRIAELSKRSITISADNYRAPGVGEHRGTISVADDSLTGRDDALRFTFDFGEGSEDYFGSYEVPVARGGGTRLRGYFAFQNLDIVEDPFDDLDIETETDLWGMALSQRIFTRLDRTASLFLTFENEHTESTLLGEPFSFSLGEKAGKSETSVIALGAEWAQQIGPQRFALRGTIKQGLRILGATKNDGGLPESEFTAFIAQAQFIRDFDFLGGAQLNLRALAQLTEDPLLSQHKLPVGGRYSVRGYRENQLVRDNGVTVSAELAVPVGDFGGTVALVPFLDYGRAWDEFDDLPTSSADYLFSGGLGVRWTPWIEGLSGELYYAHDFKDVDNPTETSQERGFHYQLRLSRRF